MNIEQFRKEINDAIDIGLFVGAEFIQKEIPAIRYKITGFSVNLNRDSLIIYYEESINNNSDTYWMYVMDFDLDDLELI